MLELKTSHHASKVNLFMPYEGEILDYVPYIELSVMHLLPVLLQYFVIYREKVPSFLLHKSPREHIWVLC